jgi:pyruvate kinase
MPFKKFANTKILATIGPATDDVETLSALIDAGVDGVRLNMSHGSLEYFEELFDTIHKVCVKRSTPLAILADLQGPKIRVGDLEEKEIYLSKNDKIEITTEDVSGTREKISCNYKNLHRDANIGDIILIDDGLIRLKVVEINDESVLCKIIEGGVLKSRKGMNMPDMKLSMSSITEKDRENLEFLFKHRVDFIALSFVREAKDIYELKDILKKANVTKQVIAKIEKPEAVKNFDEILKAADGIMVARGDLGVEMDPQDVPIIQKEIIHKCRAVGKLVITATQMMESMIKNPIPTRAEASDVANAVWDGTDVVMLSAETSIGKYPVDAVTVMNDILKKSESKLNFYSKHEFDIPDDLESNLFDSTGMAITEITKRVNTNFVIIFTHEGRKAKAVIKYRPPCPVIVFSDSFETLNILNLHYGTYPLFEEGFDLEETAIEKSLALLKQKKIIKKNDVLLFASGAPYTDLDRRNWNRFVVV